MIGYYVCISRGWHITNETIANAVYTTILVYILISVPLSFGLFSSKLKKIRVLEDEDTKYREYTKFALIRLILMCVGLTVSIFFYYATQNMSLFWLAGMTAIAIIICKPTARRINNDLNTEEEN